METELLVDTKELQLLKVGNHVTILATLYFPYAKNEGKSSRVTPPGTKGQLVLESNSIHADFFIFFRECCFQPFVRARFRRRRRNQK